MKSTLLLPTDTVMRKLPRRDVCNCDLLLEQTWTNLESVMAFIRLPLGVRVAVEFDFNGKVVVNIYHVTTTDPITSIKLTAIADVFIAWWVNEMVSLLSNEISLTGVTALNLDESNGEKSDVVLVPPTSGSRAEQALPNNVAVVATLNTAKTGRSFQGRTYIAGLTENQVGTNHVQLLELADFLLAFADLETRLGLISTSLVVASFQSLGAPRALGVATPVTTITMNSRVDTQRRRLPKA